MALYRNSYYAGSYFGTRHFPNRWYAGSTPRAIRPIATVTLSLNVSNRKAINAFSRRVENLDIAISTAYENGVLQNQVDAETHREIPIIASGSADVDLFASGFVGSEANALDALGLPNNFRRVKEILIVNKGLDSISVSPKSASNPFWRWWLGQNSQVVIRRGGIFALNTGSDEGFPVFENECNLLITNLSASVSVIVYVVILGIAGQRIAY